MTSWISPCPTTQQTNILLKVLPRFPAQLNKHITEGAAVISRTNKYITGANRELLFSADGRSALNFIMLQKQVSKTKSRRMQ